MTRLCPLSARQLRLSALAGIVASAVAATGEPAPEDSSHSPKQNRPKPQIIYHLSNVSHQTSEALHSQSKAADLPLDVGSDMPISLQIARSTANGSSTPAAVSPIPVAGPQSPNVKRGSAEASHGRRAEGGRGRVASKRSGRSGDRPPGKGKGH